MTSRHLGLILGASVASLPLLGAPISSGQQHAHLPFNQLAFAVLDTSGSQVNVEIAFKSNAHWYLNRKENNVQSWTTDHFLATASRRVGDQFVQIGNFHFGGLTITLGNNVQDVTAPESDPFIDFLNVSVGYDVTTAGDDLPTAFTASYTAWTRNTQTVQSLDFQQAVQMSYNLSSPAFNHSGSYFTFEESWVPNRATSVPAPATLGALGLAALLGRRRRSLGVQMPAPSSIDMVRA